MRRLFLALLFAGLLFPFTARAQTEAEYHSDGQNATDYSSRLASGQTRYRGAVQMDKYGILLTAPEQMTPAPPAVNAVVTGGTAVTAFPATSVAKGGIISNPTTATEPLCVNMLATATTVAQGANICLAPGQMLNIPPSNHLVSVNAATSGHAFSGVGFQ